MKTIQPTRQRIHEIDALRGFALWGILVVNIFVFHAPYVHYGEFYFGRFSGAELSVVQHMIFFFAGRFMFIFAFLFGYGCWLQYEKYTDWTAFKNFWLRRMGWLAVFGLLHALFLSFGDILLPYALLGMTLPWLLRWKSRHLFILFLIVHFIPVAEFILRQYLDYPSIFTQSDYSLEEYISLNQTGSWWTLFKLRLYDYASFANEKLIMYIPKEWSLFMLGIIAGRADLVRRLSLKNGMLFCGLTIVALMIWYFYSDPIRVFFMEKNHFLAYCSIGLIIQTIEFIHGSLYIIGLWLLWRWRPFRWLATPFRYAGKLSLTVYLTQSLICVFLFSSYGLGWYGTLKPSVLFQMALGIFVVQCALAYWWLQHYRFGPVEGLWRRLSYKNKIG